MAASLKPLWLYVHFPLFSLETLLRALPQTTQNWHEIPMAAVEQRQQQSFVQCCNQPAQHCGVTPSMPLATALAICPQLHSLRRQPAQEQAHLQQLALLAYNFSPEIIIHSEGGLWLEIAGCKQLYLSYAKLLEQLRQAFRHQQLTLGGALAHSPMAAQILNASPFPTQAPDNEAMVQQLANTKIAALAISDRQQRQLHQLGITTIGKLLQLPRAALGRRFGQPLLHLLEQLSGERPCPLPHFTPPATFSANLQHPDGIYSKQGLLFPMKRLLQNFNHYLLARQHSCRTLEWHFSALLGERAKMQVTFNKPQINWPAMLEISRLQLERISLPGSIELVTLHCDALLPLKPDSTDLFGCNQRQDEQLIDKLRARLGTQALQQISQHREHLPEQASQTKMPNDQRTEQFTEQFTQPPSDQGMEKALRPLWLLPKPRLLGTQTRQLSWQHRPLTLLRGPERLDGNWWLRPQHRDYYLARDTQGACYWLYRNQQRQWFLHGVFG